MSRRVVIGKRANGDLGIFVAPEGVDAFTASDDQLLLNITSKVSQLILLGVASDSRTVALAAGRQPFVFLTGRMTMGGVPGYGDLDGPVRPSPNGVYNTTGTSYADIASDGSYMSLSVPSGSRTAYAVYNKPF